MSIWEIDAAIWSVQKTVDHDLAHGQHFLFLEILLLLKLLTSLPLKLFLVVELEHFAVLLGL